MAKPSLRVVITSSPGRKPIPDEWLDQDVLAKEWEERQAALKSKKLPKFHKTIEKQFLPCVLTLDERKKIGDKWADIDSQKRDLESRLDSLKESAKGLKTDIDEKEKLIADLAKKWREGVEERSVNVTKTIDYDRDLVTYIRMDTGEETMNRPIQPKERQQSLPGI